MAKTSYTELLDSVIGEALFDLSSIVQDTYPADSVIQTVLMASFVALSPEEQKQIIETVGADWFVKLATKIDKSLRQLTKPE